MSDPALPWAIGLVWLLVLAVPVVAYVRPRAVRCSRRKRRRR